MKNPTLISQWNKLNPTLRYLSLYGVLLFTILWIDKQFKLNFYYPVLSQPDKFSINHVIFLFLFLPLAYLILSRLSVNAKIAYYKLKYPHKTLNINYFLIQDSQKQIYLIDNERKEIQHVKTLKTAHDLDLTNEWTNLEKTNLSEPESLSQALIKTKDGHRFALKNFTYLGSIKTQ